MKSDSLDRRALGKMLSWLANARAGELASLPARSAATPAARRIGITGAPGAGKSTLLGHLVIERANKGRRGVLAVDPSSPKTGGAILGDRIRMDELEGASEFFIRSLGSRNTTDGLTDNVAEMLDAMDDFGFDEVFLETVGVGQAEYAVRAQVDTLVLILLPDSGDAVQAMKAGIMELADVFVVSKADLPGAQRMATDISRIAAVTTRKPGAWVPPVLLVSSSQRLSIQSLSLQIDRHQTWLEDHGYGSALRTDRARYRLRRLIEIRIAAIVAQQDDAFFSQPPSVQIAAVLARATTSLCKPADVNPLLSS